MRSMSSLPWAGLGIFLVAIVAGMAFAGVRGLAAWRAFRSFERRFDRAVNETTRLIDGIEPRVAKATATGQRLEEAQLRLQESVRVAGVLFAAFGEARGLVVRVAALIPR